MRRHTLTFLPLCLAHCLPLLVSVLAFVAAALACSLPGQPNVIVVTATPSPLWLARRLEQLGIRSVNAIVDVTNLVMLETAGSSHAHYR